jgi:hypothetical protein
LNRFLEKGEEIGELRGLMINNKVENEINLLIFFHVLVMYAPPNSLF